MSTRLRVLLMQLPVPNNPGANIPLAAGYLKAWAAHEGLLEHVEIEIMPRDIADRGGDALIVDAIVDRRPDVLGLSLYTWNSERTLALAALAKQALPELLVVVGGPEVQHENEWLLRHPAVDIAVLGEGERTFVELLRQLGGLRVDLSGAGLRGIPGLIVREEETLYVTPERASFDDLSGIPSPYLSGYLELRPGEMALIECSRWCPYRCTFCLYGRALGSKLGRRYFPAERVAAEVAWAKQRGAGAIHFVEANLNLLPYFRQLMALLKDLNADRSLRIYAELRGEHLSDEAVEALVDAGLHAAEVGLQSANPDALAAVERRTNLDKWAAGTRRLYQRGIEIFLDVILGLPHDTPQSVQRTLEWIAEQQLGPYDIFTLQLLPGTGVRADAARWGLAFQDRPPYYILRNNELSYPALRALRWELREQAGLSPEAVEGLPEPIFEARELPLELPSGGIVAHGTPIELIVIDAGVGLDWAEQGHRLARQVASHLTIVCHRPSAAVLRELCWPIAEANRSIHWDIVLVGALEPQQLRTLGEEWPHDIGYLDRVAVYRRVTPEPPWYQITPRWLIVADEHAALDPLAYEGLAEVLWLAEPAQAEALIGRRGGAGLVIGAGATMQQRWRDEEGWRVWTLEDTQGGAYGDPGIGV